MRKFNDREKDIIKKLSEISFSDTEYFSHFLKTKYFTQNSNKALHILSRENKALLYVKEAIYDDNKLRKKELGEFLELISLIIYLRENRYINIFLNDEFNIIDEIKLFEYDELLEEYGAIELDASIFNLIRDNFFGLLYVSEELIQLSNNDFISEEESRFNTQLHENEKTFNKQLLEDEKKFNKQLLEDEKKFNKQLLEDEKKFNKQQFVTWFSIGLSFVVSISIFIYQVNSEKLQEKETQKMIDTQNEYLKKIATSLDSINIKAKFIQTQKKDTLKVTK